MFQNKAYKPLLSSLVSLLYSAGCQQLWKWLKALRVLEIQVQKVSVLSVVLAGRSVIKLQGMCTEDSDIMGTILAKTDILYVKCKCMVSGKGKNMHTAAAGSLQFSV